MMAIFNRKLRARMDQLKVGVVYNADQTPVFFEYIPKKSINNAGAKTVWVWNSGRDKGRLACMLIGNSHGEKRTSFLIIKIQGPKRDEKAEENRKERHDLGVRLWKEIKQLQEEFQVRIYGNCAGWWTSEHSVGFLCFYLGGNGDIKRLVLLLWDYFSAH
ncbi:hypothetical protein BBJ28_00016560 [Nothophytophthora sp. Chile5]|nr:hypothetical protein BBJ28_00016560 [Nothophytophthora sp. Chile5]